MSAIAALWAAGETEPPPIQTERMLAALAQYGQEEPALWIDGGICLGIRATPAESRGAGARPVIGGGGRYVLVADLRLDDREELAERLAVPSSGVADAELLMRAWELHGEGSLDLLNGDFAFALWDREAQRLSLARDMLGQRSLFYHRRDGVFAVASMPMGLHALGHVPRRPDPRRLAEFVGLRRLSGSHSFYEDISKVEPGRIVTVEALRPTSRRYWMPKRLDLGLRSFEEYQEAFRAEVDRAVRSRMRGAAAPLATHLSSGWDSSTVTATAARLRPDLPVIAYTAVPKRGTDSGGPWQRRTDESMLAAQTAALYPNVEHALVEGQGTSPLKAIEDNLRVFDRPLYNLCNFVWLNDIRSNAASRGAAILLTGEQGNWTISSGPHTVLADLIRERRFLTWLREARAIARNRSARWRGIAANSFGPWVPRALWDRFRPLSSRPETDLYTALTPELSARLREERDRLGDGLARRPNDHFKASVAAFEHYDFGEIRKGAYAGWGIDERDPTADRRLAEFCMSLPVEMLLKDGVRRPLARAALADRLPAALLEERHKGYQAADWHIGMTADLPGIRSLIDQIAGNSLAREIIDVPSLRRWVEEWPEGGWERPEVMARYRGALLGALSAGHFIVSTSR